MRSLLLLALFLFVGSAVGGCPYFINGVPYNLSLGVLQGQEGTTYAYYVDFCEYVPTNVYPGVTCPNAGYAYQIQEFTSPISCTLIGSQIDNAVVTSNGLQVNMSNSACCLCAGNVQRTIILNIACSATPKIINFPVVEPPNSRCEYVADLAHPNACPPSTTSTTSSTAHSTTISTSHSTSISTSHSTTVSTSHASTISTITTGSTGSTGPYPGVVYAATYTDNYCQDYNSSQIFNVDVCIFATNYSIYVIVSGDAAKICFYTSSDCTHGVIDCATVIEDTCYPSNTGGSVAYVWASPSSALSNTPISHSPIVPPSIEEKVQKYLQNFN